ncbi:hypothetical protein [Nannocystis pusilla]|uniref:hypothetical protein n=1 Tax=Nannocystis pusilla TaxID=889268 RepID=UPI003B7BE2C5
MRMSVAVTSGEAPRTLCCQIEASQASTSRSSRPATAAAVVASARWVAAFSC